MATIIGCNELFAWLLKSQLSGIPGYVSAKPVHIGTRWRLGGSGTEEYVTLMSHVGSVLGCSDWMKNLRVWGRGVVEALQNSETTMSDAICQ